MLVVLGMGIVCLQSTTKYGIQPEIFNFFLFKRISSYGAYLLNAFYPNTEEKLEVCSYFFYRME